MCASRNRFITLVAGATVLLLPTACNQPTRTSGTAPQQQPAPWFPSLAPKPKPELAAASDVARVICLYPQNPWMSFDPEGDPDPEGFRFTLYLSSGKTGKGILADGNLHAEMFRWDRAGEGGARTKVFEWTYDLADVPHSTRQFSLGWGYAPQFNWGPDVDVLGRDVDIVVSYVAPDGRIVRAQTKNLRAPGRKATQAAVR